MADHWSQGEHTVRSTRHATPVTPPYPPPAPSMVPSYDVRFDEAGPSAARVRMRKRRVKRSNGGEWAWVIIAGALLSTVIVFSLVLSLLVRADQQGVPVIATSVGLLPTPVDARQPLGDLVAGQQITLDDGRSIILQPWNGSSRFTVLVMGLDRRPGETGLSYRTDTMMLVSLDPGTHTLGILSIPRDLYVDVPGYSQLQRVNSAMVLGELQQVNYGPTLTMQTVQYNLGVRVHNYIAVDFSAVTQLIDILGGLDINVPYDIVDYQYPDMNYGYDPLILRAGLQHMDGVTSLKFARTRHGDDDFERARRQQTVVYALRDRVLNLNIMPQLIVQSPSLMGTFSQNVYTDLSLDQMIQLALYLKDIPTENMHTGVIDRDYIMDYVTAEGAQVLVPRRAQLSGLLSSVFGANYSE